MSSPQTETKPLHLRPGDLVEVRSEQEILATLDESGAIDGMPFMPEMLEYCGKRFRVYKRADKTCNTITIMESRRLYDTVHLEGVRCNGSAHGGCQALCMLFWKEAWLKRADERVQLTAAPSNGHAGQSQVQLRCDHERLLASAQHQNGSNGDRAEIRYRCQATDLLLASTSLPWWDVRQYARDIMSGNFGVTDVFKAVLLRIFQKTLRITAYRAQIWFYNRVQSCRGGTPYPFKFGDLDKTPRETLDLQPGELVQVKSYEEILATLNKRNRNRGLLFGPEMVPYCGHTYRVRSRVEYIVDEKSGKLMKLPGDCIILDGAICTSKYSENRLFCPRAIYPYWREIWLKRVTQTEARNACDSQPNVVHAQDVC